MYVNIMILQISKRSTSVYCSKAAIVFSNKHFYTQENTVVYSEETLFVLLTPEQAT